MAELKGTRLTESGSVNRLIDSGALPHLLLYGPPGTGKTSTILAIARKVTGGKQGMVLELNASDDRGIDVVREEIKNFASSRQIFSTGMKMIILDEADAMTQTAQFALRRIIEKYTSNTRFCLICNYVNKIIPALQSRCTRFRFGPLDRKSIEKRMVEIADQEKVSLDPAGLKAIIKIAEGDMRKCLNILQATSMAFPVVNETNVYLCTGQPLPKDVEAAMDRLLNHSFKDASDFIVDLQRNKGVSLVDLIHGLHALSLRVSFPPPVRCFVLENLSELEYRLASGTTDKVQCAALVSIFQTAKEMTKPTL